MIQIRRRLMVIFLTMLLVALAACGQNADGTETAVMATTEAFTNNAAGTADAIAADAQRTAEVLINEAENNVEDTIREAEGTAEAMIAEAQATAETLDEMAQATVDAETETAAPENLIEEAAGDFDYVMRSSRLIGLNIVNESDETIGEVREVLFDQTGQIRYIVFDTGDTLGLGGKTLAVEWNVIDPMINNSIDSGMEQVGFMFTADVGYLETQPAIDTAVMDMNQPTVDMSALETEFDVLLRANWFNANTPNAVNLLNRENDDLGEVEELMFDMDEGEVLYGIAEVGGFLGVAEAPVVIDWSELSYDESADSLVVDADEETLTNAPILNLDEWGDAIRLDPDWDIDFQRFWQGA